MTEEETNQAIDKINSHFIEKATEIYIEKNMSSHEYITFVIACCAGMLAKAIGATSFSLSTNYKERKKHIKKLTRLAIQSLEYDLKAFINNSKEVGKLIDDKQD